MGQSVNQTGLTPALRTLVDISEQASVLAPRHALDRPPRTMQALPSHDRPARQLHGAAAILGASVLMDSAVEHYRGSFKNEAMILPLISSALNIACGLHGMSAAESDSHKGRTLAYIAAIGVGTIGTGFHVYNVGKRVGGFRWENFFYGAPLGAPAALALSGMAGLAADRLAGNAKRHGEATLLGLPAGRVLAAFTSLGLLGTVGEAGLLHFRGNFQNPAMYLPVTLPPIAAAVMAEAASTPIEFVNEGWPVSGLASRRFSASRVSRFIATAFPRAMGGWKNWRQTMVDGAADTRPAFVHWLGAERDRPRSAYWEGRPDEFRATQDMTSRPNVTRHHGTRPHGRRSTGALRFPGTPRFFTAAEWVTLGGGLRPGSCLSHPTGPVRRYRPMSIRRWPRIFRTATDMRPLLPQGEAWRRGLKALDAEARTAFAGAFHTSAARTPGRRFFAELNRARSPVKRGAPCRAEAFFQHRLLPDITHRLLRDPDRMERNRLWRPGEFPGLCAHGAGTRRDPWEAVEAKPGKKAKIEQDNRRVRLIPSQRPAPRAAERRTLCDRAAGFPCANIPRTRRSISSSSVPVPAAARSPRLAELGFSVIALMRDLSFDPWRTSPPMRPSRTSSIGSIIE